MAASSAPQDARFAIWRDAVKLTKAMRDRFAYGEVERDAAREHVFVPPCSIFDRMLAWLERQARLEREDANREVTEETEAGLRALKFKELSDG
jgi:hypothetical protein